VVSGAFVIYGLPMTDTDEWTEGHPAAHTCVARCVMPRPATTAPTVTI